MAVHQAGMVEPTMMMMGMMDNGVAGVNYGAPRPPFPPPHAHAGVPNTMPNHLPPQIQPQQATSEAAIIQHLQQHQPPPPPQSVVPVALIEVDPSTSSVNTQNSKPKKARKKKSAEGTDGQKSKTDLKVKKKKNAKDKPKPKPKKAGGSGSSGPVPLLGKKGKTLDAQAREIALNVAEYFKLEAELGRTLMPLHSYQKRAAAATGISTATLRKLEGARREIRSEKVAAEAMVEDPFPHLAIDDSTFLDTTESRHKCKKCLKSRKFFCYTCCTPNPQIQDKLPRIKLPLKIDIIKHQSESDGKSTCPHAVILAPEDVTVYTFPCIPDYDREKVVLVFPCKEARTLRDVGMTFNSNSNNIMSVPPVTCTADNDPVNTMINNTSTTTTDSGLHTPRPDQIHSTGYTDITTSSTYADLQTIWTNAYFPQAGPSASVQPSGTYTYLQTVLCQPHDMNNSGKRMAETQEDPVEPKRMRLVTSPFERAVFIDCTWNQTKNIINDERLKNLPRVEIQNHETQFWRCQEGLPTSYLSTIEAIYYFVREYHEEVLGATYLNEYDNLLFFFAYFYRKIREKYQGGKELKAYQRKMVEQNVSDIM